MRIAKFRNERGYKVKVNDNKYMVFKSRDHFKKIEELERKVFDLVKFAILGQNEDKQNVILLRMLSIEKYIKSLNFTKIKLFDEKFDYYGDEKDDDYDDPFEIKFPSLSYFLMTIHLFVYEYSNYKLFIRNLKTDEAKEKFRDLRRALVKIILLNVI